MTSSRTDQAIPPELFRRLMTRFASGITILTTADAAKRAHGMTVSAFSSVSLDPPLVLVCVARAARMLGVLDAATHFAVNILSADQEAISRRFSVEEMELRFEGIGFSLGAGDAPVLHNALAVLQCRRHGRHDAGDHAIFVGEVVAGVLDTRAQPLVYYDGEYGRLER